MKTIEPPKRAPPPLISVPGEMPSEAGLLLSHPSSAPRFVYGQGLRAPMGKAVGSHQSLVTSNSTQLPGRDSADDSTQNSV